MFQYNFLPHVWGTVNEFPPFIIDSLMSRYDVVALRLQERTMQGTRPATRKPYYNLSWFTSFI